MYAASVVCPDDNALSRYLGGGAPAHELSVIDGHVDNCSRCQRILIEVGRRAPAVSAELPVATARAGDRFELLSELARGGQARVYVAFDTQLGCEVVLRVLEAGKEERRFLRSAKIASQLAHPAVPPIYEVGRLDDGRMYCAMKWIRGRTLALAIRGAARLVDRLALLPHFLRLCEAAAYAHSRGVVHRDLKPANVMIGEFGETVLLDWGLAGLAGELRPEPSAAVALDGPSHLTEEGTRLGTVAYMSPEQLSGDLEQVDARTDVWGLGAVLYELVTGRPPFAGERGRRAVPPSVASVEPRVPRELRAIIDRALEIQVSARYPSATAMAQDVAAYLTGDRVSAYPYPGLEQLRRTARKHRAVLIPAVVALAVVIVALSLSVVALSREASALRVAAAAGLQERAERQSALFHLAEAHAERADRYAAEHLPLSALLHASASAFHNPTQPGSPSFDPAAAARFPAGPALSARIAGHVWQARVQSIEGLARRWTVGPGLRQLALSPTGELVATASEDGFVRLWRVSTGARLFEVKAHRGWVDALAFSPDGRTLASSGEDHRIAFWDATSGAALRELYDEALAPRGGALDYSPDGRHIAAALRPGGLALFDAASGARVKALGGDGLLDLRFSPDGERLVTAGKDHRVGLWSVASGTLLRSMVGHGDIVRSVAVSPDGALVASTGPDGAVRLWDARTGAARRTLGETALPLTIAAFSPNGRWLAAGSTDGAIRLWSVEGAVPEGVIQAHEERVTDLAFAQDALVSTGLDGTVAVWRLRPRVPELRLRLPDERGQAVLSSDGRYLVQLAAPPTEVVVRDAATGALLSTLRGHAGQVTAVAVSDSRVITTSLDHTVRLWRLPSGEAEATLPLETDLLAVALRPDGQQVAVGGRDGSIRLFRLPDAAPLRSIAGHGQLVSALAYAPDGRTLGSASMDQTVRLWDSESGAGLRTHQGSRGFYRVAFSADGGLLAGSSYGEVTLWDARTGAQVRTLPGHRQEVYSLAFSPDGAALATGGYDGTLRLWKPSTGEPLVTLRGEAVLTAQFSGDGRWLLTVDHSGTRIVDFEALYRGAAGPPSLAQAQSQSGLTLSGFGP